MPTRAARPRSGTTCRVEGRFSGDRDGRGAVVAVGHPTGDPGVGPAAAVCPPSSDLNRLTPAGAKGAAPGRSRTVQRRDRRELYLSEATVKTHTSNVLAKLGLRDRVQAVIFAYKQNIIDA